MKVTGLLLEPGGGMRPEAEAEALTAWRAGAGPYWMDLAGGRPGEVTAWLTGLGLEPGQLDLLHLGDDDTRILPLAESVFFAYPILPESEAGKPAHFRCLCLDRLVITMSEQSEGTSAPGESPLTKLSFRTGRPRGSSAPSLCSIPGGCGAAPWSCAGKATPPPNGWTSMPRRCPWSRFSR